MIKKTVTYEDFDGQIQTEELNFHMSRSDMNRLIASGKMDEYKRSVDSQSEEDLKKLELVADGKMNAEDAEVQIVNQLQILDNFEEIVLLAYGIKSEDGRYFHKSPEISENFRHSAAFEAFFDELMANPDEITEFIRGILPKKN